MRRQRPGWLHTLSFFALRRRAPASAGWACAPCTGALSAAGGLGAVALCAPGSCGARSERLFALKRRAPACAGLAFSRPQAPGAGIRRLGFRAVHWRVEGGGRVRRGRAVRSRIVRGTIRRVACPGLPGVAAGRRGGAPTRIGPLSLSSRSVSAPRQRQGLRAASAGRLRHGPAGTASAPSRLCRAACHAHDPAE
jgi:hypothetical protein